jgi:membrane protease YdiL (CAAX protease family)
VLVVVTASHAVAFGASFAGTNGFFLVLLVPYLLLSLLAIQHFWDQGTLLERLAPRWGDLSIGVVTAAALLIASFLLRSVLAPAGSPREAWLYRVYLQMGDPDVLQRSVWLTLALIAIALAEELVWRGLVLELLTRRFGTRRGWIFSTLAYGVAVGPTLFLLADPVAGPNPLLVTAAIGCGIVWSFLAGRLGRLPPVMIAHAAFTYFSAVQFRWPGLEG